jgi:hypothetical protein
VATPLMVLTGMVVLVPPDGGVVATVVGAVFEATVVCDEALALLSVPCERSIVPAFGEARAVAVSGSVSAAEAALLVPEDPPPQAASVNAAIVHRRALRIM